MSLIIFVILTIDDLALQLVLSGFLGLFCTILGICRMLKIEVNEF
jgi:hypothetical protein